MAFAPSSLALGPMAATGIALVFLTGFVLEVLVADDSEAQRRPLRATIRTGLVTLLLLGSMSGIVAFVALAYALPAAITAVDRTARLRAALDFETILPTLRDPLYFLRWTVGFVLVVLAVGCAAVTMQSNDVVGLLAAYLSIAGMRAIGLGYTRATGTV